MINIQDTLSNNTKIEIKELTPKDLANLLKLQDKIIGNFAEDEQHFILKRTAEDFLKAINSDHSFVLGMYDVEGKNLISQSILSLPKDDEERDIPEYCSHYKNSDIAVFKAVMVDPDYRGNKIMGRMLKLREDIAKINKRSIAISQIAADNPSSWINALRSGMKVTKVGLDPEDDAKVVYLKKALNNDEVVKYNKNDSYNLDLSGDVHKKANIVFNKMVNLSNKGYIGLDWDKENHSIKWYKRDLEHENSKTQKVLCDNFAR